MKSVLPIIIVLLLLCGCGSVPDNPTKIDRLPDITPDYVGVTVPAGIAPLNFYISNDSVDQLDVIVRGTKGGELSCNGDYAKFDLDE